MARDHEIDLTVHLVIIETLPALPLKTNLMLRNNILLRWVSKVFPLDFLVNVMAGDLFSESRLFSEGLCRGLPLAEQV